MSRIDVLKTYKIFIGGKFPRTESGRFSSLKNKDGDLVANICLSSRKDFRNAVVSSRNIQKQWENTTALNKGQILIISLIPAHHLADLKRVEWEEREGCMD